MGVQWLTWRIWMGAAAFLSCGKMEKHWIYANSPGHDFVRGCNERTFRVSFSHFHDLSTISHVNQFQDFRHVHFSTICHQFRMPTHFITFSTICRIWRSPAICNNFSDAFVGGRLARADEWENVFFLGNFNISIICQELTFSPCPCFNHVSTMSHANQFQHFQPFDMKRHEQFWVTIVSFTFFFWTCGRIFLWMQIWCCHQPTPSARLTTRTWQGPVFKGHEPFSKKT